MVQLEIGMEISSISNSRFPNVRAYFDHNATTPPDPAVIEAVARALTEDFGNASSVHHFGQRAKARARRGAVGGRPS